MSSLTTVRSEMMISPALGWHFAVIISERCRSSSLTFADLPFIFSCLDCFRCFEFCCTTLPLILFGRRCARGVLDDILISGVREAAMSSLAVGCKSTAIEEETVDDGVSLAAAAWSSKEISLDCIMSASFQPSPTERTVAFLSINLTSLTKYRLSSAESS